MDLTVFNAHEPAPELEQGGHVRPPKELTGRLQLSSEDGVRSRG